MLTRFPDPLPDLENLAALTALVLCSHKVPPQQFDDDDTVYWPLYYLNDRKIAQVLAGQLKKLLPPETEQEIERHVQYIEEAVSEDPNRRQRDYLEVGQSKGLRYYNNNEHEYHANKEKIIPKTVVGSHAAFIKRYKQGDEFREPSLPPYRR